MNIFVIGTGTDIGKTITASILAMKLNYRYWKPIQTGTKYDSTDSQFVGNLIGKENIIPEIYQLADPISPHQAAINENKIIDIQLIKDNFPKNKTIIEGIGGLLVPLDSNSFLIDLIPKKNCKIIIVTQSGLGTINHTLLTIHALHSHGLNPSGIVMMGEVNLSNKAAIEKYGNAPVIAEIPHFPSLSRSVLKKYTRHLNLEPLWI